MVFFADRLQQFLNAHQRIEDEGDVDVLRQLFEHAAADRRFAGADLAGKQHDAAIALDPVEQCASASRCRSLMNRKRGSGAIEKGMPLSRKYSLYMRRIPETKR